jgi:heme/copper-type cytochrome/quinol oxidase subunit 1
MGVKWNDYTTTPTQTIKLCVGGIILLFMVFLKVIGKLGMPRRIVSFSVVFILAYLLQAVLNDLMLLSGMALLGEFLDFVCFQHAIRVTKENILVSKTANTTTEQVEKVLQKYLGNGRV